MGRSWYKANHPGHCRLAIVSVYSGAIVHGWLIGGDLVADKYLVSFRKPGLILMGLGLLVCAEPSSFLFA